MIKYNLAYFLDKKVLLTRLKGSHTWLEEVTIRSFDDNFIVVEGDENTTLLYPLHAIQCISLKEDNSSDVICFDSRHSKLEAENARLRGALDRIWQGDPDPGAWWESIAKDALEGKE